MEKSSEPHCLIEASSTSNQIYSPRALQQINGKSKPHSPVLLGICKLHHFGHEITTDKPKLFDQQETRMENLHTPSTCTNGHPGPM